VPLLCTICMRGGSKGVPNKNLRELYGKPLMAYTIEQAKETGLFEKIVVSTDSENIAEMARSFGAEAWFKRPQELSTDQAPKIPVIRLALIKAEAYYQSTFDVIIDLDVTSPLRLPTDICDAYERFIRENAEILITGCDARRNPYFNVVEYNDGHLNLVKGLHIRPACRQDAPQVYDMNSAVYIWKRDILMGTDSLFSGNTSLFVMPSERSIDIDSELDWKLVELILEQRTMNVD